MGKKSKAQKLKEATAETAPVGASPQFEPPEEPFFPFARYTSIVGVHTSLLLFTAFFLPRSSNQLGFTVTERPMSSRDRPQHEFLEALTANPLLTVASICLGTLVLQAWWAGWVRNWLFDWNHQALSDEERVEKTRVDASKLKILSQAWYATVIVSVLLHGILVLFGAPIRSHVLQTYSLAALISSLAVFTPAYTLGAPSARSDTRSLVTSFMWVRLFAEWRINTPVERAIAYPVLGTCVGAWLGCIPLALDWDRPWQAWPLTPAFGAILGYIVASIVALTHSAFKSVQAELAHALRAEAAAKAKAQ